MWRQQVGQLMLSFRYPEVHKHSHLLHVDFWNNMGTVYFNTYPELYEHAHSLLVYFERNLGTRNYSW